MCIVDIDGPADEQPLPRSEGKRAFEKMLLPAVGAFACIAVIVFGSVKLAEALGWHRSPVDYSYASVVLFVTAIFLAPLINSANQRTNEDHAAAGAIGTAFRLLPSKLRRSDRCLKILERLFWAVYLQFEGEHPQVRDTNSKILLGAQPLLQKLEQQVEIAGLDPVQYQSAIDQIASMQAALGGIARRRAHRILRSRYVINGLLCATGISLLVLPAATGKGSLLLGLMVSFIFTYALATILAYVLQMESGIGYDPGDIRPDECFKAWRAEIKAVMSE